MNLADMLTFADIRQLTTIASHYECQCNENSKHELIQSILIKVGRREFIEEHVNEMSVEDLRFLNSLIFDTRQQFSLEELIASAQYSRFTDDARGLESPREVISRFRQKGWMFNGATPSTRYLFQVPEDLKSRFREVLGHCLKSEVVIASKPVAYREEYAVLEEDFQLFLKYVGDQNISLNHEGVMYRRNQVQLMEMFHIDEPLLGKGGWRFGYGRKYQHYPSRLALIYDYAFHYRLIEEQGDCLLLTPKGKQLVTGEKREQLIQFLKFWLKLYKGPIPNILSLVYWIGTCSIPWVTTSSLFSCLDQLIKPFFYDSSSSIYEERIVKMMLHLGMVRIGENSERERLIQTTEFGKMIIQQLPNLTSLSALQV